VRTLRSAAILLSNTTSVECAGPLLTELGFRGDVVRIDDDARQRLGISAEVETPHMSLGPGSMRALVAVSSGEHPIRDTVARIATRLSSRTPHILWLIIVIHRGSRQIALGSWYTGRRSPRVVALIAQQDRVVDSDSDTLCALSAAASDSDIATHSRWLEILGREAVSRKFFRAMHSSRDDLAQSLSPATATDEGRDLALLYLSRLLFLSFIETKGWLDGDHAFLANQFAACMVSGGRFHSRVLAPLFFGTLNTRPARRAPRSRAFGRIPFLNGGLFSRSRFERAWANSAFTDEALGDVFGNLLTRYRFTAREDSTVWSEAAVDPEMLGKAFECLMAAPDRKTSGAYYTPQPLVEQLATSALASGLSSTGVPESAVVGALAGEIPAPRIRERLLAATASLRVLDPACGSGAFLVHLMERLAALRVHLGESRAVHEIRRDILTRSIFGVDVNSTAVWLCELRLWLSMAIEDPERDPMKVAALPNLDRNIRVGDSLAGGSLSQGFATLRPARITALRARYARTVGRRKKVFARMLDRVERDCALRSVETDLVRLTHARRETLAALRSRDLFGERRAADASAKARLEDLRSAIRAVHARRRILLRGGALPFAYSSQFADIGVAGGFDVVIGNPPWVRAHNVDDGAKQLLLREFRVFRESAWQAGAETAAAGRGFAAQVDLSALFVERSLTLTRSGGTVALIVPAKLWRSLAGGGVRSYVLREADITELHDLTESRQLFDAAVYPSLVVARRKAAEGRSSTSARAVLHRRESAIHWPFEIDSLPFDKSPGSPWLIMPPEVRAAFERIHHAGKPLGESPLGRPLLGVKTGCNEAFIVRLSVESHSTQNHDERLAAIESGELSGLVERSLLRPLHRGETIRPWKLQTSPEQIIWTHEEKGPLRRLEPHAHRWLTRWRRDLERRSDFTPHAHARWWTIFRTESAASSGARVVWSDFGRSPRAAVLDAHDPTVLLNSCYVVPCAKLADAYALAALLNSPLAAAWLNSLAEPARGGYHRYLGWTVALLPLPSDWPRAREILAPIAERAVQGTLPGADTLLGAVREAYRLTAGDVEPLLLWDYR
jgi:methylase of polypeptide subunit release factors